MVVAPEHALIEKITPASHKAEVEQYIAYVKSRSERERMAEKKITGTINLTNPGLISHNEILEMYKEIVDHNFTWNNFTIEEQNKILAAGRSNNYLSTTRLEELYPTVKNIKVSVRECLEKMKEN
jgi:3,5-epimerase/4-reductase